MIMSSPVNPKSLIFFFDVVCPYAYLAHTQLHALGEKTGVRPTWKPILLGGLFRLTGAGDGPMASMSANKARLNLLDMHRWAEHHGVPLNMPASHPRRSVFAMRSIIASNDVERAARALYPAYWRDDQDITRPDVVARVLDEAGLDGATITERANELSVKQTLRANTDDAAVAGAFGVPTFLVRVGARPPELFYGQDRLLFVETALNTSGEKSTQGVE